MRRQQRHWRGGRCTGATVSTLPGVWVTGFRGEWLPGSGWHEGTRPLERSSCLSRPPTVNPHTYSICTAATPRPQCLLHKPVRWAPRLAPTPGTKSCVPSQGGLCRRLRRQMGWQGRRPWAGRQVPGLHQAGPGAATAAQTGRSVVWPQASTEGARRRVTLLSVRVSLLVHITTLILDLRAKEHS